MTRYFNGACVERVGIYPDDTMFAGIKSILVVEYIKAKSKEVR